MAVRTAKQADNLPADLTSFVGRRHEIAEVRQLLAATRLVTLTGVGGVGKTRLALRVARDVRRAFADGVFLVELAALKDPELMPETILDALDITEQSTRPSMTVLTDYLRHRHLLLVLDNCEHLLEAAANLADALLRAAPDLRILTTSRQALMIAGEHVHSVPTLPVPDPGVPFAPGLASQYPALALFIDRAAAVVPDFKITRENAEAVTRLCHRLEGIPLAIELASVRLRVLAVTEMAARLDSRFSLLTRGTRNVPARHQTLRATIDWSYDLCSAAERTLWTRASIFVGSFGLDSLEDICTDEALPRTIILDTVAGLTEKSIFLRAEHDGQVRFRMLETIREYGQDRLRETAFEPGLRRRHRDWYVDFVERVSAEWFGPEQEKWAARLQLEHANLRTAFDYCMADPGEARAGLRMTMPWFPWLACGLITEGRRWLDRALQLDREPSQQRAWALGTNGYIAVLQGDAEAGVASIEECREFALRLNSRATLAYATHLFGLAAMMQGDLDRAVVLFKDGLQKYDGTDVPGDYPNGLRMALALTYLLQDEVDEGWKIVQELRENCERARERWLLSYALLGTGFVDLAHGELDRAETNLCEALKIKRFFHDTLGLAFALDVLAWTTIAKGDFERGAVLLGGANQLWRTFGAQLFGSTHLMARREQFEETSRKAIGDAAFDTAFARGGDITVDQTLAFALRERGSTPAAESLRSVTELTPREREIADLVSDGMSNKGIAAKLVISLRTAEGHVEHILTKLGFNSRAQVATWVAEQRTAAGVR